MEIDEWGKISVWSIKDESPAFGEDASLHEVFEGALLTDYTKLKYNTWKSYYFTVFLF